MAGGLTAGAILYGAYLYTPSGRTARAFNQYANEANKQYKEASKKLQQNTPDSNQIVDYIKDFCYSYVAWVPGGRQYVDAAFKDYEKVRQNHGEDVDKIIGDAYKQFQKLSKSGLSLETASKAVDILTDLSKKIGGLASDALGDILDNHPQMKEQFGGSIDQLKQMGEAYGPQAKEQVDKTWKQVREVVGGGLTAENLNKAKKIIEEKVEMVRKMGDEAWAKGMEQAKPYLDKNPKIKQLVRENEDVLKRGNASELFERVKKAVESGNLGDLEGYVKKAAGKATDKAKSAGSQLGLDQYFDMIPEGGEILPRLKQLKELAEKHSEEGQELLKETMDEVKRVLEKKSRKAEEITERAKQEAK
jgi:cell division septum initiation protein DivIVA